MAYMTHTSETMQRLPDRCTPLMRRHNQLLGTVITCSREPDNIHRALTRDGNLVHFAHQPDYDQPHPIDLGHHVTLTIAPEDVCLEHPDAMDVMSLNTWPGRIVLAARRDMDTIVIVKILGQFSTLVSTQRISWLNRAPHAWDRVLVHIPPATIHISHRFPGHLRLRPRLLRVALCSSEAVEWNGDALKELRDWSLNDQPVGRALRKG